MSYILSSPLTCSGRCQGNLHPSHCPRSQEEGEGGERRCVALWAAVLSGLWCPLCQKVKSTSAGSTPFRRVPADTRVDPKLADNSFEAKAGSRGAWGEKANKDLKFTKGMWENKCLLMI